MTKPPRIADPFFEEMRAQIEATTRPAGRRRRLRRRAAAAARGLQLSRWPVAAARRVQLILLGGASLTGAAVALTVGILLDSSTATPPAYAGHDRGSITITLNQLATRDISALNNRFDQLGIAETVIPIQPGCHSPDGSGAIVMRPDPMMEDAGSASITFSSRGGHPAPSGWHYVLAAKQLSDDKVLAFIGALKDPIPTCLPYRAHRP